ncbi:MAG: hypothetical protein AAF490_21595 [Chloroflexota bacterium]
MAQSEDKQNMFWDLANPMLIKGEAEEGTMMGFKCLRVQGKFFATLNHRTNDLIVKLPKDRVLSLIDEGLAAPFSPNGRVFKEWATITKIDESYWEQILQESRRFVMQA